MQLVALAEASDGKTHPGHMVIGRLADSGDGLFVGYRFDPSDLPEAFRPSDQWRKYLLSHAVPGYIVDETNYVQVLRARAGRTYYRKAAPLETSLEAVLPPSAAWKPHAAYSFNPDDFHSPPRLACYNCVTWAVELGNQLVDGFLIPVPQGRIGEIIKQLVLEPIGRGSRS